MKLIATLLALAQLAQARQVNIAWNAAPVAEAVTSWRVWRGIDLLATVQYPASTLTIPDKETATITVTAINANGESLHSAPLILPPMIWIQKSTDLITWENVVQIPYIEPRQFIRMQLPAAP